MATGDLSAATVSASGKILTLTLDDMDGSQITAFEAGTECTVTVTRDGYTSTTLGTVQQTTGTVFSSASIATLSTSIGRSYGGVTAGEVGRRVGPPAASVLLELAEPIYNDDTFTVDLDAGAFDDGTNTSNAATGLTGSNSSTLDYPKPIIGICGILDASSALSVQYSAISGTVTAEAVAFGHFPNGQTVAAVKFDLDDGATTLSETVTAMTRSAYDPDRFYTACQDAGLISSDPFSDNGGGSGVFAASFDTTSLVDGSATLTATAYPVVGDADSLQSEAWAVYIDNNSTLTQTSRYVDSRATISVTGISGTFTANERVDAGTSGAILRFRNESGGTFSFSAMDETALVNGETLTGADSGATCTTSGTATYNGAAANDGSEGSPKRILTDSLFGSGADTKYNIYLMGDTTYPSFYSMGRNAGSGSALDVWQTIQPNTGLDKTDIYIEGPEGATFTDCRILRVHLKDVTIKQAFRGWPSNDTALWVENCEHTTDDGRVGPASSWGFANYLAPTQGGSYITDSYYHNLDTTGIQDVNFSRDVKVDTVNGDCFKNAYNAMEVYLEDNDSPDVSAHEDSVQFVDATYMNTFVYNVAAVNIITGQQFLADDAQGLAFINYLGVNLDAAGAGFSQLGDSSGVHTVDDVIFAHVTFVNSPMGHRNFAGSTDRNSFFRYCVFEDITPAVSFSLSHMYLHNHLIDSSTTGLNLTAETAGNPWENGVGPDTDDNATKRDYHPATTSQLKDRVPSGERYVAFDLFGGAIPNDGTGYIGALQALSSTSFSHPFYFWEEEIRRNRKTIDQQNAARRNQKFFEGESFPDIDQDFDIL